MKVFNKKNSLELSDELSQALFLYRQERKFVAKEWVEAKAYVLNEYMRNAKLNTVVVAVSGGVDSALVLALVNFASKISNSPIKKIVPITLPALNNQGATGQDSSSSRASELCNALSLELFKINVSPIQNQIIELAQEQLKLKADDWSKGQTVAYSRTPVLYGMTSILSANGFSSIIAGTTNRDEGAYLGYVGKASDGMVDVQLISDLHKSEVYAAAKFLDVPDSIISAVCTGDMFDGRVDEEVFGTSYDFVELYLWYLNLDNFLQENFKKSLGENSLEKFNMYAVNLENLHYYNAHKYLAGSPAVHLDIFESNVKGGWQIQKQLWQEQLNKTVDKKFFKHLKNFSTNFQESIKEEENYTPQIENNFPVLNTSVKTIDNMFTPYFLRLLKEEIKNSELDNINEIGGNDKIDKNYLNKSRRVNIYNPEFSALLWNKIKDLLPKIEVMDEYGFCETDGHVYWKAVGINPYIKLSQYNQGGMLVPHYDGVYRYNNIHRNMKTLIIYLENNDCYTRILNDYQQGIKVKDRVFKDGSKNQIILDKDILFSQSSIENKAIIFDNKLLHDSTVLKNGRKTILLTEVVYEKIMFPQKG